MVHVVKVRCLTLCDCDVGVEVCGVDGVWNELLQRPGETATRLLAEAWGGRR